MRDESGNKPRLNSTNDLFTNYEQMTFFRHLGNSFTYNAIYKLEKTKIIYKINFYKLENLNVKWSGADSISQNFAFRIEIRERVSDLGVGIHSIIYNTKTAIDTSAILFGEQNI